MSHFRPSSDQRETLKKAAAKFAHDPIKSKLLSRLDTENADYVPGNEEWNHLKFCVEQHHLHAQVEVRRDPTKKSAKLPRTKLTPSQEGSIPTSLDRLGHSARISSTATV